MSGRSEAQGEDLRQPHAASRDETSEWGLVALVYDLDVAYTRLLAALARRRGMTLSEIVALQHVQTSGGLMAGELAARLQMSTGATTTLIDRLERAGQVARTPHPRDRRGVVLNLTAAGQEEILRLLGPYLGAVSTVAQGLDEGEAAVMTRTLARITTITEEAARDISAARDPHATD